MGRRCEDIDRPRPSASALILVGMLATSSTTPSACCTGDPGVVDRARSGRLARSRSRLLARLPTSPSRRALGAARRPARSRWRLLAVLVDPAEGDVTAIDDRVSDAGYVGALPGAQQRPLSAYLLAHQDGARYEVAAESATADRLADRAGRAPDRRPDDLRRARVHEASRSCERLIAGGEGALRLPEHLLRQAQPRSVERRLLGARRWVRAHGTDVSHTGGPDLKADCCSCCPGRSRSCSRRRRSSRERDLAGRARVQRQGRRAARARHGVHGRGALPHAAVPDPAGGPR